MNEFSVKKMNEYFDVNIIENVKIKVRYWKVIIMIEFTVNANVI